MGTPVYTLVFHRAAPRLTKRNRHFLAGSTISATANHSLFIIHHSLFTVHQSTQCDFNPFRRKLTRPSGVGLFLEPFVTPVYTAVRRRAVPYLRKCSGRFN